MNNEDDVIKRMAKGMYEAESGPSAPMWTETHSWVKERFAARAKTALRAVSDTHRLVPVVPTEKMIERAETAYNMESEAHWPLYLRAAPDYTLCENGKEADDE